MIPLAVPDLSGNEGKYLQECIESTFVSSVGPFVDRLEVDAANAVGSAGVVATSAGTTALHASLVAFDVHPGDLVLVPSFTFIASANAIRHAGADPWFLDVEPGSWCIGADGLRSELETHARMGRDGCTYHKASGRRVTAVMPVYTLGNVPDMDAISEIAREWNLAIVADAACAIGATYRERKLGGLADLSCISLNGNKTITAGGGGLVASDDLELLAHVKHLTTTARVWPDYDFDEVGYNYRMTNLQAAVAVAQLERLDELVSRKREVRRFYDEAFEELLTVASFPVPDWCNSSCWFSGFVTTTSADAASIVKELNERGIGAKTFWKPVHLQLPYKTALRAGELAVTESLWGRIVTLPCSTAITDAELDETVASVKDVLS